MVPKGGGAETARVRPVMYVVHVCVFVHMCLCVSGCVHVYTEDSGSS